MNTVGSCPHCGAPIYQSAAGIAFPLPVTYSCECRHAALRALEQAGLPAPLPLPPPAMNPSGWRYVYEPVRPWESPFTCAVGGN